MAGEEMAGATVSETVSLLLKCFQLSLGKQTDKTNLDLYTFSTAFEEKNVEKIIRKPITVWIKSYSNFDVFRQLWKIIKIRNQGNYISIVRPPACHVICDLSDFWRRHTCSNRPINKNNNLSITSSTQPKLMKRLKIS
uniref:Uncharacterized protein n=1 Tax=Romanomermis culicivorax TaxID=13658 RepID=A0A915HIE2_ROMCU